MSDPYTPSATSPGAPQAVPSVSDLMSGSAVQEQETVTQKEMPWVDPPWRWRKKSSACLVEAQKHDSEGNPHLGDGWRMVADIYEETAKSVERQMAAMK